MNSSTHSAFDSRRLSNRLCYISRPVQLGSLFILVFLVCIAMWTARGRAATNIVVNSTNDNAANDSLCTLREAITAANSNAASGAAAGECAAGSGADDTISFTVTGVINLTSALPAISSGVTINGPGAGLLTVQRNTGAGATNFRIFLVNALAPNVVTFSGLTIKDGNMSGDAGGGIRNSSTGTVNVTSSVLSGNSSNNNGGGISNSSTGTVNVSASTLSGNSATGGGNGGGIFNLNLGTVNVAGSTLSGNSANLGGGIINNGAGTINVTNSTLSGNSGSSVGGGGIANGSTGTVNVTSSTLSGNSGSGFFGGGGISNISTGVVNVKSSTLSGNSASTAGGIRNFGTGPVTLRNSIVALNTATSEPDLRGPITTQGFNIFGTTTGATAPGGGAFVPQSTDQTPVSAAQLNLGPLASNGGPTQTRRLLPGSVAIDKGDDGSASPTTDQRGAVRPFDDPSIMPATGGDDSDIGAYELQGTAVQSGPAFVVNTPDDHDDGANGCTTGDCTLREAITAANAIAGTDTISFNIPGSGPHTIQLTTALPALSESVNILNTSGESISVRGEGAADTYRIFTVNLGQTVNISGLTITNGAVTNSFIPFFEPGDGGGILNTGLLTLTDCTVSGNSAELTGGGIHNRSTVILINSTVSGNSANGGGGIFNNGGALTLTNSTVSGNSAETGGGIFNRGVSPTLTGVTVTNNRATGTGGGIFADDGTPLLRSTIVADNYRGAGTATEDDIAGNNADDTSSYNLIGTGGAGLLTDGGNNNQIGVANPGLGPLANNGGPTQTHALLAGSPAIDRGESFALTTDQRGVARPRDHTATANPNPQPGDLSDIGAYEIQASPTAADATITGSISTQDGAPLAGTVVQLSGSHERKTITNASGNYRFDNIETTGFYTVTPARFGYSFGPENLSFSQLGNMTEAVFVGTLNAAAGGNVINTPEYFVRQQYLDFLGREPDEAGFNFWSDQILSCGNDFNCAERRTINVSAAYFLSIEFQETGGLVDGLYRASFGRAPLFSEFGPDTTAVAKGVIVGDADWLKKLTTNKQEFVEAWVARPAFRAAFDNLSNTSYVDTLVSNTRVEFSSEERNGLVAGLENQILTRAAVLQLVAQNEEFVKAKFNEAFVRMQYFGYLRRDPDQQGFDFWLRKLNEFEGNFERAEMVKAFINSGEYRARFAR